MPIGTLVLPDPDDVREGVQYGADGTELVGTMYVRSDAASGSLLARLIAIVRQIPDKQNVTYYPRATGAANADTYGDGVVFEARRQPLTSGDSDGRSRRWARWQLYATAGQAVKASRLGKLVAADGTVFHVEAAARKFGDLIFDCDCVQAVG